MKIQFVPLHMVHQTWPQVEAFVADAVAQADTGEYSVDQIKQLCTLGQWTLLVAVDEDNICGAGTVTFFNRPNDRVALVTSIGGRLITSADTFAQLKQFAISNGATCLEGAARESVARLWKHFGLAEKYRIVGVKL
jgi:hypothetical protein